MRDKTVLTVAGLAALGIAGYLLYKKLSPTTQEKVSEIFQDLGADVYKGTIPGTEQKVYTKIGGTTYAWQPGDYDQLNLAQKALLTLDKVVPGTFLTKWVLGG